MDLQPAEKPALAGDIGPCRRPGAMRQCASAFIPMDEDVFEKLGRRLGRVHARQRIGIEDDHEARVFGQGLNFFHPENWYFSPAIIRNTLKLTGLYWRARKNAERIQLRHNDMNEAAMQRLAELLPDLTYDLCVLTGDYRGKTFGPFDATIEGMGRICAHLKGPVYAVLGNHDTIRMVPALEEIGVRMLLNEAATLVRGEQRIHLAGIDDAHYYRVDNI